MLDDIRTVISDPGFDRIEALREQRELQHEAEQRWGDTDAWQQSRQRTARYTKQDWQSVKAESEAFTARIAEVYRSGAAPDGDAAMEAVEAHRDQIDERFYDCPPVMHVELGEMYVTAPRFTATTKPSPRGWRSASATPSAPTPNAQEREATRDHPWGSSTTTGISRSVFRWYSS